MKKEEIKKFYTNYRIYIFPAVVVLSSLILIVFIIYPQIVTLLANQATQKDILNKSKFLEVKAQTLENYDQADLDRKVGFALNSYPVDRDSIYAVGVLQRVVSQLGFNIVSISLGSSGVKNANAQSYNFKLELVGPLSLLPSLLTGIENSPRLMRVSGVEVTGLGASQGVSIALGVDMLYAAAPTGFGSVDSALPSLSEKDEEVITRLARMGTIPGIPSSQASAQLGPRGKVNPFE